MSNVIQIDSKKPLAIADIVAAHSDEQVLIWTQYDEEGDILHRLLPGSIHLTGKTSQDKRIQILDDFRKGFLRVLISKPRLLGTGLNLQFLSVCVFSWSKDSFEEFYQAVGRLQRYGQKKQVGIYIPYTDLEKPMLANVMAKQKTYLGDSTFQERLYVESLLDELREFANRHIEVDAKQQERLPDYDGVGFRLIHDDCILAMARMPENQFDMSVFSPPFADLYSYTDEAQDLGNSNSLDDEFALHFSFFTHQLYRVMKPGCIVAFHVAPLAVLKSVAGHMAIRDFPAECRELMEGAGFLYHGKATIGKNPQAQAIRTKAHSLLFKTLRKDSRLNRFAIPDYLMKFSKPGEAPPIQNLDVSNEEWIKLAHPIWDWVNESNTLNKSTKQASEGDVKHICPLQLDVIDAAIRLWSGRGEHVFSPFLGIGSEGVMAVRHSRRFTGVELKREYFEMACENISHESGVNGRQLRMNMSKGGTK
jgi:DNA modification methylase